MVLTGNMDRQNRRRSLDSLLDDRLYHVLEPRADTWSNTQDGDRLARQLPQTAGTWGNCLDRLDT